MGQYVYKINDRVIDVQLNLHAASACGYSNDACCARNKNTHKHIFNSLFLT